jgi:hypothetical protein
MEHISGLIAQWIPGFDPAAGTFALPLWAAAMIAALVVGFVLLALGRAGSEGMIGALSRVALLLIGAVAAWAVLGSRSGGNLAAERMALDQRALAMTTRALAPGSALACLDATAGDTVEASCEKALFATPESTAAAVSYVAAELSLLADGSDYASRSGLSYESTLSTLRSAAEIDRYGIVAHVLAVRDGCTADQCGAFAFLHDSSRVSDNIVGRKYEFYVLRHASEWPPSALSPVAVNVPPPPSQIPAPGPASPAKAAPNNLFFPSSASIPPVSIMNAEPGGPPPQAGATADPAAKPPVPPRKPAQQARRPASPPPPRPAAAPAPAPAGDD